MPVSIADLKVPDECILNQEEVIVAAANYFEQMGWQVEHALSPTEPDVVAKKDHWTVVVKAKGSKSKKQKADVVFDNSQLRTHVADQMEKLMRFQQTATAPTIFIMANPNVYRIKSITNQVSLSLDKLDIVRMWINPNEKPDFDIPKHLYAIAEQVDL
ncbi:hypothetical protein [Bacillus sp. FJAT-42315]|uniref:hypothetical protein n=1 Tax=Bacillus sp. FJAT-42315 TaxID=2014077 RepID=UPI000C240F23|nr:hypothetical protein [Bacillus sp. FJAT-42315]